MAHVLAILASGRTSGFTAGLLCWVVGERLHRLSAERELFTIADAIHVRFESRGVTGLAALAVLAGTVAYLGLQLKALGVAYRIDRAFRMQDLRILERPHHVHQGVDLALAVVDHRVAIRRLVAGGP